ncbi:MAG: hypothetical protein GF401_13310 [Chitinivibrionales bacterium]|nr:hypothetical protein [Chitinivibrionales bacterium]
MKPRKWVLVFFISIFTLSIVLYQGVRFLEKQRNLERILIQHISPLVGGSFDVEKVRLGFLSALLVNVRLDIPLYALNLTVNDIKVSFSLLKLLQTKGDFGRSIDKVILLEPHVAVALFNPDTSSRKERDTGPGAPAFSFPDDLPLEYLYIKKGTARFIDNHGNPLDFGEQLDGRIWADDAGVFFDCRGKIASRKRNMSFSGMFSRKKERHRLSLRLDHARIRKPLYLKSVVLTEGVVDGVCEFFISDTLRAGLVDARGWFTVDNGVCSFGKGDETLSDIAIRLRCDGATVFVDSASCFWRDVDVDCRGQWDFAQQDVSKMSFAAQNINLDKLFPSMPDFMGQNILGNAWLTLNVIQNINEPFPALRLSLGGLSVLGIPLTESSGLIRLEKGEALVDSLFIQGEGIQFGTSGKVRYAGKSPSYSMDYMITIDTLPALENFRGRIISSGSIEGKGARILVRSNAKGENVVVGETPLGDPALELTLRNNTITFGSSPENNAGFTIKGILDSAWSSNPGLTCSLEVDHKSTTALLSFMPSDFMNSIQHSRLNATIKGALPQFEGSALLGIHSSRLKGNIYLGFQRLRGDSAPVYWRVSEKQLQMSDTLFPIWAEGIWRKDSIEIDSLHLLGGLAGSGIIRPGARGSMDLEFNADSVSLRACNKWFFGGDAPITEGSIYGKFRCTDIADEIISHGEMHVRNATVVGLDGLSTDLAVAVKGKTVTVLPAVIRKDKRAIIALDTLFADEGFSFSGSFEDVPLVSLIESGNSIRESLDGSISGTFRSELSEDDIIVDAHSKRIAFDKWSFDSPGLSFIVTDGGLDFTHITASDSNRSTVEASGFIPFSFIANEPGEFDTLALTASVEGDLLATLNHNHEGPIGGTGKGTVNASLQATADRWVVQEGTLSIPEGELEVGVYVPDQVKDFSIELSVDKSARVHAFLEGKIRNKPISITTSHAIPKGYDPLMVGPLDFGVFLVQTPKRGVDLHIPGFMEIGAVGGIEFAAKSPFEAFALCGPIDQPKIVGTMVLRDMEFTFPFIYEPLPWEFDPLPYVEWEIDVKPRRNTVYFYELRGKKRAYMRFCNLVVDQNSVISPRGKIDDGSFRIYGSATSHRGDVFFGKTFNRNIDVGVEFAPQKTGNGDYNNYPIIWGSAEAFSDTSRIDRVKLSLKVTDPVTGAVSEKGRVALMPPKRVRTGGDREKTGDNEQIDSLPNFTFHVSSSFEEIPGGSERDFYREAGLRFSTFEGAGEFVTNFGEQYIHRYFLQRFERRLAKKLRLDVISFETSIASNYFYYLYKREYEQLGNQWNLLANMGITIGRYFLRDLFFVKARGELMPVDTLLRPEYSIGLEFVPAKYFMMELTQGFYMGDDALQYNPQVRMQLQVPIKRFRNY